MPVYLRRQNDIPTPAISDCGDNDQEDFLQDPDQRWDELPQPFRFLNKILTNIFERAWEIANSREVERITEAAKIRPPQYECAVRVKEFGNTSSMCSTPDGRYVVLGLTCGVAAVDALTREPVDVWQQDGVELISLTCCIFQPDVYLICAIDDMGHGRLFSLANGVLFSMQTINEDDSTTKSHVGKLQASPKGNFVGIFLENPSTKENWLEIHKTPRDTWNKELESALAKSGTKPTQPNTEQEEKVNTAAAAAVGAENNSQQPVVETVITESEETEKQETPSQVETNMRRISVMDTTSNSTPRGFKFTATTLVLKVKPPSPVQGISWSSPHQSSKTVDCGSVIGTGVNHLVSAPHLDTRLHVFTALHQQHVKYLPEQKKGVVREPTFHFLTPGRMMPFGLESAQTAGETNSVMVWWTNHNQIHHYSLIKPAKEIEHRPDLVWPSSAHIVATAVSRCTSLIAVATETGIVTVWDKYLGMKRRTVYVSDNIRQMEFLDPSVCPQEESNYPPYQQTTTAATSSNQPPYTTSINCYVLVRCAGARLYLVECGGPGSPDNNASPSDVSTTLDGPNDDYTLLQPIDGIPQLVLTCRNNGRIYIHNVVTTDVLCEVVMPGPYEVVNPWQPVTSVGGLGQMLYIRGKLKPNHPDPGQSSPPPDGETLEGDVVFGFQIRSFPTLDGHLTQPRPELPYTVHNTVETRAEALFTLRIAQQAGRKERMQDRWSHLKDELEMIRTLRGSTSQPRIRTNLGSPLSVKRSTTFRRVGSLTSRVTVK